jgi:broad specificity phosphatase PhoE
MRAKPGQHLNQAGVSLARRVGGGEFGALPPYDLVITTEIPRAFETAIAMGFAVDEQPEGVLVLPDMPEGFRWPMTLAELASAVRTSPAVATVAARFAEDLRTVARRLPPGGSALVVSHGGIVELSALGLLPDLDVSAWGGPIGYTEGIRFSFEGDTCVAAEPLRVGPEDYLVEN